GENLRSRKRNGDFGEHSYRSSNNNIHRSVFNNLSNTQNLRGKINKQQGVRSSTRHHLRPLLPPRRLIRLLALCVRVFVSGSDRFLSGPGLSNPKYLDPIGPGLFGLVLLGSGSFGFLGLGESEILTADPRNVEHILKTRFDNYTKEENNWENLGDLLGHGIFAVDGEKWRQQRKLASFEFSGRVLRDFSCSVFRMNVVKVVGFVSEFGLSAKSFDAQTLCWFYKFGKLQCFFLRKLCFVGLGYVDEMYFGSIFKVGFGVELKCLDGFSKEGEEFMEAFDEGNGATSLRLIDPLWKMKWFLNVGSQARKL
uniref:Cytochrome P450 n=1 Tax=Brassica oleracea var. oleracea TaxID=109376 RepID=A0A0D3BQ49_BRAOL